MDIKTLVETKAPPNIPAVTPGDTVRVTSKFKEGDKERLQHFQGVVIKVKRGVSGGNFTLRRVSSGVGVERTFFFNSPLLEKVEVVRHGQVRRAKLYYMRRLSAKEARLKERRERMAEEAAAEAGEATAKAEVETETETEEQ